MEYPRLAALAVLSLALLAGCTQKTGYTPDGAANAPPPPTCNGCTPVDQTMVPHLKPGSWQSVASSSQGSPYTGSYCSSGRAIGPRQGPAGYGKGCTYSGLLKSPTGSYVYDIVCVGNGVTVDDHSTYTGDFTSAYTIDSTTTSTDSAQAPQVRTSHTDSHYLGDCTPGEQKDN